MRMFALLFLLYAALPGAVQTVSGEPDPVADDAQKPKVEETIVVTATRSERSVSELPVSTTVIREADIKAAPAIFADDLVRTIVGVHMPLAGGPASFTSRQLISMHGLGGTRALVLLDGIPIHDPYYGTVQWQKVPLDGLRQVEVVRGGNASLFGNFALGGTINLLTRPIEGGSIRADASYGTQSTERANLSVDHVINDAWAVRVSHFLYDTAGFIRQPGPGPIDVDGWNDTSVTAARVQYQPSERTSGFLKANWSEIDVSQGTRISFSNREILDLSAGAQHVFGSSGLLSLTVFRQKQEEEIASASVIGQRESEFLSQDSIIPANAAGASLVWSTQRRGAIPFVSIGVDVQQVDAEEARVSLNRSGAVTQRATVTGRQQFAGVYGQASWRPIERLEILASARLDYYKNDDGSEAIVNGALTRYPTTTSKQFDPRISFRYTLSGQSAVRGAAYRAFRAPTLRELYRTSQTGVTLILGNPFLEPETLVGAEMGVEWATTNAHVEVNVYRSDVDGLQSRALVGPNTLQNLNLGKSKSQGVEVMGNLRLSETWALNVGYTYADSTIVEDPSPELVGKILPEVSPHIGTLGLRYRGRTGMTVDLRGRVLSRQYGEPANVALSPAHRIVDISASYPVRSWVDVYAVVENVLDESYFYALTPTAFRSGQPRAMTAGVRVVIPSGLFRKSG